jgi:hypothetical protein
MAKYVAKKRSGGRYAGRYTKKKTGGRHTKKKSGTATAGKQRAIIAAEVQKVLNSGAQNELRKVTLELLMDKRQIFVNGKGSGNNCLRIPVTVAIPAMAGPACSPDVRRRGSNKIMVTGVSVRVSVSASDETRMMVLLYEPHETVRKHLEMVSLQTLPNAEVGFTPEKFQTELVAYYNLGLVSKHGPLMTRRCGIGLALDSVDGTPFESRVATHPGRPMGKAMRKVFGGGGLRRTVNWDQASSEMGAGYTTWTTHRAMNHWTINKQYTYSHECESDPVFRGNLELLLYIDCPSLVGNPIGGEPVDDETQVVGAVVRNVLVDVYFHDM